MSDSLHLQPVILCGGSGTRLWPLSRAEFPKQFLSLFGKESLFQLAVKRLASLHDFLCPVSAPVVIGNEDHRFIVLDQIQAAGITPNAILLEPTGRNTAPALTLAALSAMESGTDPVLVVCPADQLILDTHAFVQTLESATRLANGGAIVTLGVTPDRPETGYGYIRAQNEPNSSAVQAFIEKPDLSTAERYLAEGCYYWNSGIFVLKASVWMKALHIFRPDIETAVCNAWKTRRQDGIFSRPERELFNKVPAESIDYAVMEKCPGSVIPIHVLPLCAGWNDLGSWDAAWQSAEKDTSGNAHSGDALIHDCRNVFVHASSRLVSVVGLQDIAVIETADAVLVTDRKRSQEVRKVVADLSNSSRDEHTQNRKVHRPWGWYDSIDQGPGFKVKRIMVKPGASLSLQRHQKRAEHWVVVSGTATVQCGDEIITLQENQSTYIPLGEAHRLSNPGRVPLEIVEVQSGDYLGEDDIERLDDQYGRVNYDT